MSKKYVIVGGGIAGLFSALLLSKQGHKVTVVEKAGEVGGLLRSIPLFKDDIFFDFGTHILTETGVLEIDELLFSGLDAHTYDFVKVGTYKDFLYERNGFITDFSLSESDRKNFLTELIVSKPKDKYSSLEEQLINSFGKGYYENLLKDSIQKFFFTSAKNLVPDAHLLFGLGRIIVADEEKTKELKNNKKIDSVIGFHSNKDGVSRGKAFYPKKGGVGQWIETIVPRLKKEGVEILTDCNIQNLSIEDNKISRVDTDQGNFYTDELLWTISPFLLLQLLKINPSKSEPPKLLSSAIFNFVVDRNYLTDLHYLQCHNKNCLSFRVTLYNNFTPRNDEYFLITTEVLLESPTADLSEIEDKVFKELIEMNIVSKATNKIFSQNHLIANGFPVPTEKFIENSQNQNKLAEESYENIKVFGKCSGKNWFMNDIVINIHNSLNKQ